MSVFLDSGTAESRFVGNLATLLGEDGPRMPRLVAAAEAVSRDPQGFVCWLASLTRDAEAVRAVVARSYWHPNGFAKLVLHTSAVSEFKIRMHVWPESAASVRGEMNPHSHRWDFASTLLTGQGMVMPEYREVADEGDLFTRYRYGIDEVNPATLVFDGAVRLVQVKPRHLSRGSVYSCDTHVIHTAEPLGRDLTATVVVQGPHRVPTTAVFCAPGQSEDQPNRALSVADFRLLVKAVISGVGGCGSLQ
ncbi:hypothetical protein ACFVYA_33010 [Amycolatopsis sp. NPDC058278]|uniref:hypothetical protein n=1 Tax=Amycolatopsis sp. NPDC058278 TaxID=3346417 RepID=UPI0036DFA0F3